MFQLVAKYGTAWKQISIKLGTGRRRVPCRSRSRPRRGTVADGRRSHVHLPMNHRVCAASSWSGTYGTHGSGRCARPAVVWTGGRPPSPLPVARPTRTMTRGRPRARRRRTTAGPTLPQEQGPRQPARQLAGVAAHQAAVHSPLVVRAAQRRSAEPRQRPAPLRRRRQPRPAPVLTNQAPYHPSCSRSLRQQLRARETSPPRRPLRCLPLFHGPVATLGPAAQRLQRPRRHAACRCRSPY